MWNIRGDRSRTVTFYTEFLKSAFARRYKTVLILLSLHLKNGNHHLAYSINTKKTDKMRLHFTFRQHISRKETHPCANVGRHTERERHEVV